jgi:glycosyltransferase involved in cell wall biosynthesis
MLTDSNSPASEPLHSAGLSGVVESVQRGCTILSPGRGKVKRRLIYLDSYGGTAMMEKIKAGDMPAHHLRGCLELVRMGYEVALANPVPDFWQFKRKPFPHDWQVVSLAKAWLGREGIIFCGHNVLAWVPIFRKLGLLKCHVVSQIFGCEDLPIVGGHSGVITLTQLGADYARKKWPKAKVAHLGWGADLSIFPKLPYTPNAFFSCGITLRDHKTMAAAFRRTKFPAHILVPGAEAGIEWPSNVTVIDGGKGWNVDAKKVSYHDLLHKHYGQSAGSLLILKRHPWVEETAAGFTELIEIMAMARPIIITRTNAFQGDVDVEREKWGIFVDYEDADGIAKAVEFLGNNPREAEEMGRNGRRLAEQHFNIERYARDLDTFFESL